MFIISQFYYSTVYDIIDALNSKNDPETVIEIVKSLMKGMQKDSELYREFEVQLEIYAIEHNRCVDCNWELTTVTWSEPRPYGDTYAMEEMSELRCCNCNTVY